MMYWEFSGSCKQGNPFTNEELIDVKRCNLINCEDCKAKEKCLKNKYTEQELEYFVMCPNNEILPKPDTNSYTYERFLPRPELFNGNKEKVKFVDEEPFFLRWKILFEYINDKFLEFAKILKKRKE
jgi:hypothetical protein